MAAVALDDERVRILETRAAPDERDVVAIELVLDDVALALHHLGDAREELLQGGTARLHRRGRPAAAGHAGLPKPSTASRNVLLGIVPVSTHTPPTTRPFSTTAARLPELGRLDGGALAGGAAADADEIEVVHH